MTDKTPSPVLPRNYNVLSLDGGGIRGVIEATLLDRLNTEYPKLTRNVDLITAVSTGALIAVGLAAELPMEDIAGFYSKFGAKIFEDSLSENVTDLFGDPSAQYSNKNLKKVVKDIFGNSKLGDLNKKVAIVAFDLDNGIKDPKHRSWKTKVFHNFKGSDSDADAKIVDVILYTTAVPTLFPVAGGFTDGGVAATNPAMIGLAQALDPRAANQKLEDIKILSLGTGKSNRHIKGNTLDWGFAQWAPHLLFLFLEGGIDVVNFQCKQILGDRFLRLDPSLGAHYPADAVDKLDDMIQIANDYDLEKAVEWLKENWI